MGLTLDTTVMPAEDTVFRELDGESVLLIDDTWTTGASAQSAAAALKAAGAGAVAAIVVGRHVNRDWHDNDDRLKKLAGRFEWTRCVWCDSQSLGAPARAGLGDRRGDAVEPGFAMAGEQDVGIDGLDRIQ